MSLLTLCFVALVACVSAHQCKNGQRVTCMAVQPLSTDSGSQGQGYSAKGTPHCTANDNKKVYCLVNHNYHRCGSDREPCCADGSNPWHQHHGGSSSPASDSLTCKKEATTETTTPAPMKKNVVVASASQPSTTTIAPPAPVILDDMSPEHQGVNSYEGSYQPCMHDAYKGQFHHDWARSKGSASFTFTFEAPLSGCYKIEEYHPGSDSSCSVYLPRNARLDVHHHDSQMKTYFINQAIRAAQWNEVGSHMFSSNTPGKLIMRNAPGEQCGTSDCFWIADAFRLTWKGSTCSESKVATATAATAAPSSSRVAVTSTPDAATSTPSRSQTTPVLHDFPASSLTGVTHAPCTTRKPVQRAPTSRQTTRPFVPAASQAAAKPVKLLQGMLKLHVHLAHGSRHDNHYISASLKQHSSVLKSTLAAHFKLERVQIRDIAIAGRRLEETSAFNVKFSGWSTRNRVNLVSDGLTAALQEAWWGVDVGFSIMGASAEWKDTQPADAEEVEASSDSSIVVLAATLSAIGAILVSLASALYFQRAKFSPACLDNDNAVAKGEDQSNDVMPAEACCKKSSKADDDLEVISIGSTRSPVTDQAISEDSQSNEDRNLENLETVASV